MIQCSVSFKVEISFFWQLRSPVFYGPRVFERAKGNGRHSLSNRNLLSAAQICIDCFCIFICYFLYGTISCVYAIVISLRRSRFFVSSCGRCLSAWCLVALSDGLSCWLLKRLPEDVADRRSNHKRYVSMVNGVDHYSRSCRCDSTVTKSLGGVWAEWTSCVGRLQGNAWNAVVYIFFCLVDVYSCF